MLTIDIVFAIPIPIPMPITIAITIASRYLVCSCSNFVHVLELVNGVLRAVCHRRLPNMVMSISGYRDTLAVADMRLGVHFFHLHSDDASTISLKLHMMYDRGWVSMEMGMVMVNMLVCRDPQARLVTRVLMLDEHRCVGVDKYGAVFFLSDIRESMCYVTIPISISIPLCRTFEYRLSCQ